MLSFLSKDRIKWVAIISFLLLIFVPGKLPMPIFKNISIGIFGGLSLLSEVISLKYVESKEQRRETIILIVLTLILVTVFFFI